VVGSTQQFVPTTKPCTNPPQLINPSGGKSPQYLLNTINNSTNINNNNNNNGSLSTSTVCSQVNAKNNAIEILEEAFSGYNSGDEHIGQKGSVLSPDEWEKVC
jgi:OTU domain-containing protein 5